MCENNKSRSGECRCKVERVPNFAQPRLLLELAKKTSHGYELIERLGQEGNATPDPGNFDKGALPRRRWAGLFHLGYTEQRSGATRVRIN